MASLLSSAGIVNRSLRSFLVTVSAMAGVVGPILFGIVVIDLGYRWIGYDPLTQTISELGARNAPNMSLQALNFGVLGTLTIIFAIGLTIHNRIFRSTSILVGVYGIGTSLVAFLPCDPGCPAGGISVVQVAHSLDALISFVTLAFAPLLFWRASRTVPSWIKMSRWSLRAASVSIPLLFVYLAIEVFSLSPYTGLFQRIFFGLLFAWILVIAVQLLRLRDISLPPVLAKTGQ
jgi:Protein of unknown function (DUF998)